MITKFKLFEKNQPDNNITLYHGSSTPHDFTNPPYLYLFEKENKKYKGTFFTTTKGFAIDYMGQLKTDKKGHLYKATLRDNLNIFDTHNINDCTKLINHVGELENDINLYDDDEIDNEDYIIDTPEKLYNLVDDYGNNFYALEEEKCIDWLYNNHYDGIIIYEDGIKNYLLFYPVIDKITNISEI